jgi:hypothetical protein
MAEANLKLMTVELTCNAAGRKKYPGQVLDIQYDRLVADPLGTVQRSYDHFKLPWTAEFEAQMSRYLAENPQGKHGRHKYNSADFGMTDEGIRERIGAVYTHTSLK